MNEGEEVCRARIVVGEATTTSTAAICLKRVAADARRRTTTKRLVFCWLISFTITCPISSCWARPTVISRKQWDRYEPSAESAAYDDELQTYLTEFGYLPKNNPEVSNLRSDVAVKGAIARLQDYAGLNVTSKLDEPTKRLLRTKRCGMADLQYDGEGRKSRFKRYTLFGDSWKKSKLTYKVVNWSPHMDQGQTRRSVYDAFKLWSDASSLEFIETMDDKADIIIEFARGDHGDGYPFDGKNVVLAHAFFPGGDRGGDAHFDADEVWTHLPPASPSDYEKVNFFTVAAHEFGHSLGLGHSKDRNALMFAYYRDYSQLTALPYDDTLAIQKLYGVGKNGIPEAPPSTTETPTPETDRPTYATYAPPAGFTTPVPDACHSRIDAVARIRNEVFVFRGKYFWRYDDEGAITSDPTVISRFWHGLPEDLDGVDAVFQRPQKETIIFFKGRQYWEFSANYVLPGYPKDVSTLGLPDDVRKIDTAFVWGWTDKAYFFADKSYWRLDEENMKVEQSYPRTIGETYWEGVPTDLDAAYTDKLGVTYFFKNSEVYKFDNLFSKVRHKAVKISEFWPHCQAQNKRQLPYLRRETSGAGSARSSVRYWAGLWTLVLTALGGRLVL